jgi:hypothetical protein
MLKQAVTAYVRYHNGTCLEGMREDLTNPSAELAVQDTILDLLIDAAMQPTQPEDII